VGSGGALYISDTGNHTVRRFLDGRLTTLAGFAGDPGPTNGPAAIARFNAPLGIVVHPNSDIYVADSGNHVVRRISTSGEVTTLAGVAEEWGAVDGPAGQARFNGPVGLAIAPDGALVVADALNHALRRVSLAGTVTTLAGRLGEDGCVDGPLSEARFCKPAGVAFDSRGTLYVVDAFTHLVRKVSTQGVVSTVAGRTAQSGDADGANGVGRFFNPYGIAVRPDGSVMVSDTYNATLRQVLPPFAQSIVRRGTAAFLEWDSVIGLRYEAWMRDGLEQPWRLVGPATTATGKTSTVALPDWSSNLGPVFYRIRQNE
jgi:DNA-binding beta-propeller fold protein YncE